MIATTKLKPISGPYCFIRLSNHKAALVDENMHRFLNRFKWTAQEAHGREYAVRKVTLDGKTHKEYMHRVVAQTPPELVCHHVNGYGLDNRRANLQNLTRGEHDHTRWHFAAFVALLHLAGQMLSSAIVHFCSNVPFVSSIMCLLTGRRTKPIPSCWFGRFIVLTTPTTMLTIFPHSYHFSVTPFYSNAGESSLDQLNV